MQIEHLTSPPYSLRPVFGLDLTPAATPGDDDASRAMRRGEVASDGGPAGDPAEDGPAGEGPAGEGLEGEGLEDIDLQIDDDRPPTAERRLLCMIIRQLTHEMLQAVGVDSDSGGRRRSAGHVRQVAMYVCHVAYSMPMGEVAQAFGRDRSTVGHACRMVEDRRDDPAYDGFVTIIERMASAVYLLAGRRP